MNIGILEADDFSIQALAMLKQLGEVSTFSNGSMTDFLCSKHILFVRLFHQIDKTFLDRCFNLKIICSPTTGLNHIDLDECARRDISVISLKNELQFLESIAATPEHTLGLILSLLRNYKECFLNKHNPTWSRDAYKGNELSHNNVGIIGFGRVGRKLAKYLEAFNSSVSFFDPSPTVEPAHNATRFCSARDLIRNNNIVVLCASFEPHNFEFVNEELINEMKGKYFINTSRGELINEDYLIDKIEHSYFRGVALDVIQNEQGANNLQRLLELTEKQNLIITPHVAGATYTSMEKTETFVTSKLMFVLKNNDVKEN